LRKKKKATIDDENKPLSLSFTQHRVDDEKADGRNWEKWEKHFQEDFGVR
jgi:hypothetical protein